MAMAFAELASLAEGSAAPPGKLGAGLLAFYEQTSIIPAPGDAAMAQEGLLPIQEIVPKVESAADLLAPSVMADVILGKVA